MKLDSAKKLCIWLIDWMSWCLELSLVACVMALCKDLIAKPPISLEDLFTQTHNFIRAKEANTENRFQEPIRETKQQTTYKDLPRSTKDKYIS